MLLDAGANPSATNGHQKTPLQVCVAASCVPQDKVLFIAAGLAKACPGLLGNDTRLREVLDCTSKQGLQDALRKVSPVGWSGKQLPCSKYGATDPKPMTDSDSFWLDPLYLIVRRCSTN